MITSVMSIHAEHRFTQGFRILCRVRMGAAADMEGEESEVSNVSVNFRIAGPCAFVCEHKKGFKGSVQYLGRTPTAIISISPYTSDMQNQS
jgi:hypothetical protein